MSGRDQTLDIAFIGTRGVPARYGGFETAIEEVGARLADHGHRVRVYCRNKDQTIAVYRGMSLVNLPAVRSRSTETLTHTGLAVVHHLLRPTDVVVLFNVANAVFLPLFRLRRRPVAVHVDGLEWKRAKWGRLASWYYLLNERLAVRWGDALIADARAIGDYYRDRYGADTTFLPYGAPLLEGGPSARLAEVGLESRRYHLVVARFEPENNLPMILEGYTKSTASYPLVVVGDAPYRHAEIERAVDAARHDSRIRFLGSVWDQNLLNDLYANAEVYLHGHSVGGTNPSLLRAMAAGAPVVAFDVNFNREVLGDAGLYFATAAEVAERVVEAESSPERALHRAELARARVREHYDWDRVAEGYEALVQDLVADRTSRRGARGPSS